MRKIVQTTIAAALLAGSLSAATVYATVNGNDITEDDLKQMVGQMPGAPEFDAITPEIREKLVKQLVDRQLLIDNAKKSGVEKEADYKEALEQIKGDLALRVWMKQQMDALELSDKEVKAFYEKNMDQLSQPEKVHARHILVKSEAEAKKIIAELAPVKASDLDAAFAEAAKTYSTGPSGKRGGDLGFFDRKQMVKPFSDAAFALKSGEMTKAPVQTNFGWHVIYSVEKQEAATVPFEEVKEQMEEGARMEKFRSAVNDKVEELTKNAKITYPNK